MFFYGIIQQPSGGCGNFYADGKLIGNHCVEKNVKRCCMLSKEQEKELREYKKEKLWKKKI